MSEMKMAYHEMARGERRNGSNNGESLEAAYAAI